MSNNGKKKPAHLKMTDEQERLIFAALERTFQNFNDDAGPIQKDQRTRDFVFHMTDWYEDLVGLADLYSDPARRDQAKWDRVIAGFLYHAVGHLMAAAKLNDTFSDPFEAVAPLINRRAKKRAKVSFTKALRSEKVN